MKSLGNDEYEIRVQDPKLAAMRGDHPDGSSQEQKKMIIKDVG